MIQTLVDYSIIAIGISSILPFIGAVMALVIGLIVLLIEGIKKLNANRLALPIIFGVVVYISSGMITAGLATGIVLFLLVRKQKDSQ